MRLIYCIIIIVSCSAFAQQKGTRLQVEPRMRVIVDNDFSGDPDGLFQLAHLLLSPSVEIKAIIGSHLSVKDGFDPSDHQANNAVDKVKALLKVMKLGVSIPVIKGSNTGMANDSIPVNSKAVDFIVREAMRNDTQLPLYILCGAGLTEVASAVLSNPDIEKRFTLVWIGGPEYPGIALPPPGPDRVEYNLNIDRAATKAIFNSSSVNIWQVPRNAYRQCMISFSQLTAHLKNEGKLGGYLYNELANVVNRWPRHGETYILGDSPLVLLTALQSFFEPDACSSKYILRKAPWISDSGGYTENSNGRPIRVYTQLDTRFMFDDFFDKLAGHNSHLNRR